MFASAVEIASRFTLPVVISQRSVKGKCSSVIGACTLVNSEGWVVTSAHLIGLIARLRREEEGYRKSLEEVRDLEQATASHEPHRKKKLRHLHRPSPSSARDHSTWFGSDGVALHDIRLSPENDLAIGRLEPFAREVEAPVFWGPGKKLAPGTPLCRIGYPFHEITPTYDEERRAFVLPAGAVPPPLFPIEGILTRILRSPAPESGSKELGTYIETSSPGLPGQSGGPIFDTEGRIWGLQSHTRHFPLGFKARPRDAPQGMVEHQILNVGVGSHVDAIVALLEGAGVEHRRG